MSCSNFTTSLKGVDELNWSWLFQTGVMPDRSVLPFASEEEYEAAYYAALDEWLRTA